MAVTSSAAIGSATSSRPPAPQTCPWPTKTPATIPSAAASMFAVIETTVGLSRYELALVASRAELAAPSRTFPAQRI